MNELAVTIILTFTAVSNVALWGLVLGFFHRYKYDEYDLRQQSKWHDKKIHGIEQYLKEVRVVCLEHKNVEDKTDAKIH